MEIVEVLANNNYIINIVSQDELTKHNIYHWLSYFDITYSLDKNIYRDSLDYWGKLNYVVFVLIKLTMDYLMVIILIYVWLNIIFQLEIRLRIFVKNALHLLLIMLIIIVY
jgi:hypothetical protein